MSDIVRSLKLLNYNVEIIDKPFEVEKGPVYDKTAKVSFYNHVGKIADRIEYGLVDLNILYEQIKNEENINLNSAYVLNLSLTDYKKKYEIGEHDTVTINGLSAKQAFFDCEVSIDFSYAVFMGRKTVFEKSIFGNGIVNFTSANFAEGNISFKHARFGEGKVLFNDAVFGGGDVSFQEAMFGEGNLYCVNTNFGSGKVDFKAADFGDGGVDFKYAKFGLGDTSFEKTKFGTGKKDFKAVEFGGGRIDFRRVEFGDGDISFEGTEFGDGKVMFRSAEFGHGEKSFEQAHFGTGEISFEQAHFGTGKVSFETAIIDVGNFSHTQLNCYFDLRFESCNHLNLSDTIVRDIIDIKSYNKSVKIKSLDLSGMKLMGKIFIDWKENDVKNLIHNQTETSLDQKAEQFRILKENFNSNGQYDDEDMSYIEFKRAQASSDLETEKAKGKKHAFIGYGTYYFQQYLMDFVGRYGTSPLRVMANMAITFSGFSIFYFIISEYFRDFGYVATTVPDELNHMHSLGNCFYYSAITFFTIGYGDYFSEGYLKPFAAFEGFSGVFLMSYFTVAFVRKILR